MGGRRRVVPYGSLVGDYNLNGIVDAADYVAWRDTGINGAQGYTDWRANFGKTGGASNPTGQLVELRNEGLTEIAPNGSISLGQAFKTGGTMDLVFQYGVDDGFLVQGGISHRERKRLRRQYGRTRGCVGGECPCRHCTACLYRRAEHMARDQESGSRFDLSYVALALAIAVSGSQLWPRSSPRMTSITRQAHWPATTVELAGVERGGARRSWHLATVIDVSGNPLAFTPAGGSILSGGAPRVKSNLSAGNFPPAPARSRARCNRHFMPDTYSVTTATNSPAQTTRLHCICRIRRRTRLPSILVFAAFQRRVATRLWFAAEPVRRRRRSLGGSDVVNGQEYLLVAKLTWSGTNYDQAEVWIDPPTTPGHRT